MRSPSLLLALGLFSTAPLAAQTQRFADLHRSLPWHRDDTVALALGDVDGDGDLDLLLGNTGSYPAGQNRLYRNEAGGAFLDATSQLPVNFVDDTRDLALGDVDGDGDLDALIGNFGQLAGLLLNNGTGSFADATVQLPPLVRPTRAVALADVDADGDLDALIGNDSQQNRFYENNGAGLFFDATWRLPAVFIRTYALAVGDVDGDADLDILVGNGEPGPFAFNRLQLNDGTGFFSDATGQIPLVSGYTRSLALGDVDGDGDPDALLGNDLGSQSLLQLNDGTGVFTDATSQLPAFAGNTKALAVGDLDGDGDLDALLGNNGVSRLYVNGGTGIFTNASPQLPSIQEATESLALGDVDGDGDLDALLGNGGTQNRLYLNDGSGTFADVTAQPAPETQATQSLALGDIDGDGDLDALLGNDGQSRLYVNAGTGIYADATPQIPAFADDTYAVALGDVDGDGDLDALLGNAGQSRLYLNGGIGVFADATSQLPAIPVFTRAAALGDVDADGDLDAYMGNFLSANPMVGGQDRLYLNDGTGSFSDATTQIPSITDFTYAVALGDVDGDADLDALIGNYPTSNRLVLNDGTGVFTDATNQLGVASNARALALGDVDGDGDLDALVAGSARLLLNGGGGMFTNAANQIPTSLTYAKTLALGDVDEDGDLDALAADTIPFAFASGGEDRLYLNNGSGVFTEATGALPPIQDATLALALGDVDGDGDLDAVFGNFEEPSRLPVFNVTRQLAWRGVPRIGKPLVLDLRGAALGGWQLAASLGTANLPLPPFGTLRLSPPTLIPVAIGAFDPDGRASVSFSVPAFPSLVGVSVYWQALVGLPLRLTNLEVTTFTNL
ncbi:MAG: VCBS repeat-containing protein [Planctomycetes bacterium]|nr:VCBS repeat-containing protein [Planctomycetota bacterium]